MSLRRKSAGVLLANWLVVPLGLASSVVVVRLVGAEGRGTLVVLVTLVTLLATIGQFGFPASSTYYLRKEIYGERTLLANYAVVIVLVTVVCGGLMLVGSSILRSAFLQGADASRGLIVLAVCSLPLVMLTNFIAALLLARGKARAYGSLTVIPSAVSLALTLILVAGLDLGVTGALLAVVSAQVLAVLIGGIPMLRATRGDSVHLSRQTMGDLTRFGMKYYTGTLSLQIFRRGDNLLLAYLLDVQAVAYYSIGVNLYEVILGLPRAVSGLVSGEAAGRAEEKAGALVARASRGVVWVMVAAAIVLGVLSWFLIPPVYGGDFEQARVPALILLASGVLFGFALNLLNYFVGVGRPGVIARLGFIGGVVNLGLSVVLIQEAGIVGDAFATLIASGITMALFLFSFARMADIPMRSTYFPPPSGLLAFAKRGALRVQERGG